MRITDVKVRKVMFEGKIKGVFSITIDDNFVVHDIKLIEGQNGLFVAMPSKKMPDGEYKDIAHPVTAEARQQIQTAVITAYKKAVK